MLNTWRNRLKRTGRRQSRDVELRFGQGSTGILLVSASQRWRSRTDVTGCDNSETPGGFIATSDVSPFSVLRLESTVCAQQYGER